MSARSILASTNAPTCWAIFAMWITLHKGMGSLLLGEDTAGAAWLLLGLVNVIAAFGTLLVLSIS
jgi:hypothetical protein